MFIQRALSDLRACKQTQATNKQTPTNKQIQQPNTQTNVNSTDFWVIMLPVFPSCKSSRPSRLADLGLDGTKGLASWYNLFDGGPDLSGVGHQDHGHYHAFADDPLHHRLCHLSHQLVNESLTAEKTMTMMAVILLMMMMIMMQKYSIFMKIAMIFPDLNGGEW